MALCILAPEYYLGKALAENSSANHSRGKFKDEENWDTAHAFFADMRGFIMQFETTAVKMDLVPLKGSEEGRERHRPYHNGDPTPYMEQNVEKAIEKEWKDCLRLHGKDCPYRGERESTKGSEPDSTHTVDAVEEHGPNAVPNAPQATSEAELEEVLKPLDLTNLPQPLHIPSPALPEGFSCQTTAVASPGSQLDRQWLALSSTLPITTNDGEANSHRPQNNEQETPVASSPEPPVTSPSQAPLDRSSSSTEQPRHILLPHPSWTGLWPLSSLQMLKAKEMGLIPPPPYIALKSLKDQSKSDAMVKALAIWQLVWLCISVLARAATHLPITLLEITVLAFSALSILTYILLWHKPQDVKVPHYISATRPLTRTDVIVLAARAPVSTLMVHEFWLHGVNVRAMGDSVFPWPRGVTVNLFPQRKLGSLPGPLRRRLVPIAFEMDSVFFGMGLGGAIFGAIHFAAWNFAFPTPVERLLWRIACGIIVGFPVLMSATYVLYLKWAERKARQKSQKGEKGEKNGEGSGEGGGDGRTNIILRRCGHALVPVYFLARLYLLVEVFRSLAYSPPGVFQSVAWPLMVPHYA